jgi:hypothetical protein
MPIRLASISPGRVRCLIGPAKPDYGEADRLQWSGARIAPMGVGEVLASGVYLARRNFGPLAVVTAWGAVPSYAAIDIASAMVQSSRVSLIALGGILAILGLIGLGLISAAVTIACARLLHPTDDLNRLDATDVYAHAALRLWPLVLLLLVWALLAGPFMVLLPVGIYVSIRWAVAFMAIVLDGDGAIESLRRSWAMTRSAWWHTAIVVLVGTLVTATLGFAVSSVAGAAVSLVDYGSGPPPVVGALSTAGKSLALIATEPFSAAIMVVLYYELASRSGSLSPVPGAAAPEQDPPPLLLPPSSRRAT